MIRLNSKNIKVVQKEILTWYSKNKRDLPWRRIRDPYKILVSEVMLQQTQVSRVIPKYEAWLEKFPDVESMAQATTSDVLRLWSGLGYNRRALYLQKTAKALNELRIKNHELWGERKKDDYWPKTVEELMKLPGIGRYTAGAVACFAFDQQIAVVDTNIRRVILTQLKIPSFKSQIPKEIDIQEIADQLLPEGKAYEWNQALMDYASAMLKKEKIPIVRQSRFIGSDRYYRGKILRLLLQIGSVPVEEVGKLIKDNFTPAESAWLDAILVKMEKDGLLIRQQNSISLRDS